MAINYAIDASSVINLNNAGALETVCRLTRCRFWLSPIVLGECQPSCAAALLALKEVGAIGFIDDAKVPTDLFLSLLADHDLGEGETESIAVSKALDFHLCCEDRKARKLAEEVLGPEAVIGSVKLLRWCVEEGLLPCDGAFNCFGEMKKAGGFLPEMAQRYFC
jgi:predicted nucleic acid-binding protein